MKQLTIQIQKQVQKIQLRLKTQGVALAASFTTGGSSFQRILKANRRKKLFSGLALIGLLLFGLLGMGAKNQAGEALPLPQINGPFRLHVVANSNNGNDQALKLLVRDAVVEYLTPLLANSTKPEQAQAVIEAAMPALTGLANGIVKKAGYTGSCHLGVFPFPAKAYGDVELPPGDYKALKIILGEGKGENWWCVLFPPLCFVDQAGALQPLTPPTKGIDRGGVKTSILLEQTQVQVKLKISEIFYIKK